MSRQTVQTSHGSIEYETVTCDFCGDDRVPDEAVHVAVGRKCGEWPGYSTPHIGITRPDNRDVGELHTFCIGCAQSAFGYAHQPGVEGASTDGDSLPWPERTKELSHSTLLGATFCLLMVGLLLGGLL